jgi:CRP-like cAMP-binding protein
VPEGDVPLKRSEAIALLGSVALFAGLSDKQLLDIAKLTTTHLYGPGENIVEEGGRDAKLHAIVEGAVSVTVGKNRVGRLGPGSYFGEVAVIDGGPRAATVTAETEVRVLTLAHWNVKPLLREQPAMAEKVMVGLCRCLRDARSHYSH